MSMYGLNPKSYSWMFRFAVVGLVATGIAVLVGLPLGVIWLVHHIHIVF